MALPLVLRVLGLVLVSAGIIVLLGLAARHLYAAPFSGGISVGGYHGEHGYIEYLKISVVTPSVLELEWPRGFPGKLRVWEAFSGWNATYTRGSEAYVSGGVYVFLVNSSEPFLVEVRSRPWHDLGYDLQQGVASAVLGLTGLFFWAMGGRLACRACLRGEEPG